MSQKETLTEEGLSVAYLITREFHTAHDFSIFIERESNRKKITIMECLLDYCETKKIEPESIAQVITKGLVEKIEAEAAGLHLINATSQKLPFDDAS